MSFPSKYNGKCSKCGGAIVAGQLINYADGAARHPQRGLRAPGHTHGLGDYH